MHHQKLLDAPALANVHKASGYLVGAAALGGYVYRGSPSFGQDHDGELYIY